MCGVMVHASGCMFGRCTFLSVDTGIRQEICSRILWDNCMHGACVGVGI